MIFKEQSEMPVIVNTKWCKGCGICVLLCPQGVLKLKQGKVFVYEAVACIKCRSCELHCPDYALWVRGRGTGEK